MRTPAEIDSFLLDTYKESGTNVYRAGAITFRGRKKVGPVRWADKKFESQEAADAFVRAQFTDPPLREKTYDGEFGTSSPFGVGMGLGIRVPAYVS